MPQKMKLDRNEYLKCAGSHWGYKDDYYKSSDKNSLKKIIEDQCVGNLGEMFAYKFCKGIGIDCDEPYFEEYTDKNRSAIWNKDLIFRNKVIFNRNNKQISIKRGTVKSQTIGIAKWVAKSDNWKDGASFTWQLQKSGRFADPLLENANNNILVFCVVVKPSDNFYNPPIGFECEGIISCFYWPDISNGYFKDPLKPSLKGLKKVIYRKDIIGKDIIQGNCMKSVTVAEPVNSV